MPHDPALVAGIGAWLRKAASEAVSEKLVLQARRVVLPQPGAQPQEQGAQTPKALKGRDPAFTLQGFLDWWTPFPGAAPQAEGGRPFGPETFQTPSSIRAA